MDALIKLINNGIDNKPAGYRNVWRHVDRMGQKWHPRKVIKNTNFLCHSVMSLQVTHLLEVSAETTCMAHDCKDKFLKTNGEPLNWKNWMEYDFDRKIPNQFRFYKFLAKGPWAQKHPKPCR